MNSSSWNLDQELKRRPQLYKLRVFLLGLFGTTGIWLILSIPLGLVVAIFVLMLTQATGYALLFSLLLVLVVPEFLLLRLPWSFSPRPQGLCLDRKQAPQLFALFDELAFAFQTQSLQQVTLTPDFKLTQHRSFQVMLGGGTKTELVLGLPIMQALSPEELRAALAHEFARFSARDRRLADWLFGLCQAWNQVNESWQGRRGGVIQFLLGRFLNWYLPGLIAYSLPIFKQDEFFVDRKASNLAGVPVLTSVLVNLAIKELMLAQEFWPMLYGHAYYHAEPPADLFDQLACILKSSVHADMGRYYLRNALKTRANLAGTHSCLHDRLLALGQSLEDLVLPIKPLRVSAAQAFLNKRLPSLVANFNKDWQVSVRFRWKELYASAQARPQYLPIHSEESVTP